MKTVVRSIVWLELKLNFPVNFLLHFDFLSSSPTRLDSEPNIRIVSNPLYMDDVVIDELPYWANPEAETTLADDSHPKMGMNNDIAPEKPGGLINAFGFDFGEHKPE